MHRSHYYLFVLWIVAMVALSGCKTADLTKADDAYRNEQYSAAIDMYKRAYPSIKDKAKKAEVAFKIADSYTQVNSYNLAEGWYKKAIAGGYTDPQATLGLAQTLKNEEKYEEALTEFQNYQKEVPSDTVANEEAKIVEQTRAFNTDTFKTRFSVEPFKLVNSPGNDFAPVIFRGEGLIFSSDREEATGKKTFGRTNRGFEDLFLISKVKKGRLEKWGEALPIEGLNSDLNEGAATIDAKGNDLYFTKCNSDKENTKGKWPNCVIMHSERRGKAWAAPEKLPFCTDTTLDYGQPAISPDGTKMIFVMDGPFGKGKHDLYLTTYVKRSRTWSDPVNLGDVVNTPFDEMYPYFYNDTTLYFSSNGRPGLGGLDIYMTHGTGTDWATPKHLQYPLNSGGDDFGITFDETGLAGYFTTNRVSEKYKTRNDDIFSFTMTPLVFTLSGIVTNSESKLAVKDATVTLMNEKTKEKKEIKTDAKGAYKFTLAENTPYSIYSLKQGFFPSDNYMKSTEGLEFSANLKQDMMLKPPIIELHNIYYGLDSANIRPASAKVLDSLVGILNTYPTIVIEMGSHTDCRASMHHNDSLSQARSDSSVHYLVTHGIDSARLVAKGYGERELLNNCGCEPNNVGPGAQCTEEEHQINRRTTVKVLRWDYVAPKKDEGEQNNGEGGDNNGNGENNGQ